MFPSHISTIFLPFQDTPEVQSLLIIHCRINHLIQLPFGNWNAVSTWNCVLCNCVRKTIGVPWNSSKQKKKGCCGNLKLERKFWLLLVPIILIINVLIITNPSFIKYLHKYHIKGKCICSKSHLKILWHKYSYTV